MNDRLHNPFVIVGDIPEPYFCDREKETQKLAQGLINESNIVLISPRRMGKSKLVRHCYNQPELKDGYYTFYIDLLHTTSLREFTYTFGKAIFDQLKSRSEKTVLTLVQTLRSLAGTFGFDAMTNMPTFALELGRISQPEYTLSEIFEWMENADKPCIVCFDEFQRISTYPDNKQGAIEALLRGHIQHLRNSHYIFSGSERHLLTEMFYSQAKPFYNSASQLNLKAIDKDKYLGFADHWMNEYGKQLDADALGKYYDLFEGTTYYLQKMMHEAFAQCPSGETCTKALLDKVYQEMLEEMHDTFLNALGRLSDKQKDVLYAIAREEHATRIMSAAFIRKHALPTPSMVQTAVSKLLDEEIIHVSDGTYSVSDVLFRRFLQQM